MKKHIIRKKIFKILSLVIITVMLPTIITLALGQNGTSKTYHTTSSGKYVTISDKQINERLDVEDFIGCAIMGQLEIESEEELQKAFAVILRTYIVGKIGNSSEISADKLDIPYITYSELESLWGDDFPTNYNKLQKVISDTSLQTILCDNELISPYYHSISSGATRNGDEVLGDGYPYLRSVSSLSDSTSSDFFKSYYFSNEDFTNLVRKINSSISIDSNAPLVNLQIVSRCSASYVLELSIGGISISGLEFANALSLNSPNFQIEEFDDGIRVTTNGVGHGLGLSLFGSAALAEKGSSYIEILNYYYSNITIQ